MSSIPDKSLPDMDDLLQDLHETIAWCLNRPRPWNPRTTFRSLQIAPNALERDRVSVVLSLVANRRRELGLLLKDRATWLKGGRLMVYWPDLNLAHGLEEAESEGFVDLNNVPPWDTWVAFLAPPFGDNYLISWVPGELVELVNGAIEVCPEECIMWLDDAPGEFAGRIRSLNLRP